MYGNDLKVEKAILKLQIKDMGLRRWQSEDFTFIIRPLFLLKKHSKTELVKHEYGFHCMILLNCISAMQPTEAFQKKSCYMKVDYIISF